MKTKTSNILHRYTNLAATIHLLKNKVITLLNPETWDDKNDSYFLAHYKNRKRVRTVLALCFAQEQETYHHWRVFSNGTDGICITFGKSNLLSTFENDACIEMRDVQYRTIEELRGQKIALDDLPFLKRAPYRDEHEFRVVFVNLNQALRYRDYPIKVNWIKNIRLSPWMPEALVDSVRDTLKSIDKCSNVRVYRSTLTSNDEWKKFAARVR